MRPQPACSLQPPPEATELRMQERSAFHRPAPTSRARCRSAISLSTGSRGSNYRCCSRHLRSVSVSMQLVPIDRTSVWARTLFYTYYKTVISLSCIMHNRALINDDSNKRATGDIKSLAPMGSWQEGPRSWSLGSAAFHAPRPDEPQGSSLLRSHLAMPCRRARLWPESSMAWHGDGTTLAGSSGSG